MSDFDEGTGVDVEFRHEQTGGALDENGEATSCNATHWTVRFGSQNSCFAVTRNVVYFGLHVVSGYRGKDVGTCTWSPTFFAGQSENVSVV